MYIDILNTKEMKDSEIEKEALLIRLALLMSDKVEIAGVTSFFFSLKNYYESLSLAKKMEFIKRNMKIMYGDDPKLVEVVNRGADLYLSMMRKKSKTNDMVLGMMKLKPYIDHAQEKIFEFFERISDLHNIGDLKKFSEEHEDQVVSVLLSDIDPQLNIRVIKDLTLSNEDIILFDSRVFKIAEADLINNPPQSLSGLRFIYGGIICMTSVNEVNFDLLKPARDSIISETGAFRSTLLKAKGILCGTQFSVENLPVFEKQFLEVMQQGSEFEKVFESNVLLNKLKESCSVEKRIKISLALTSIDNLMKMLNTMEIISEREMMYILQSLSKKAELSMSIPFLISEDES